MLALQKLQQKYNFITGISIKIITEQKKSRERTKYQQIGCFHKFHLHKHSLIARPSQQQVFYFFFTKESVCWSVSRSVHSLASDLLSSLLQPAEQLRRVIGDDDVSTCITENRKKL